MKVYSDGQQYPFLMDQRTTYLLQILESIGAPLMHAVTAQNAGNDTQDAQTLASLLGKTVEASIELGNIMDINPAEAQDDTLRVALAGLAGPLVAGQYQKRSKVPESTDLKKITGSLQAVLTFSDNFTPTPETVERLKSLEASGQAVDGYQSQIQYMQALIPVVEAIAAFPFGQPETKLIMDVSDRLVKRAVEIREALLPNVGDEAVQKITELAILRGLALLYSACHKNETQNAQAMGEAARNEGLSMDPVWKAFATRTAMLEALASRMVPKGQDAVSSGTSGGGPAPVTPPEPPPAQPVTQETPPAVAEPPAAPPPQPPVEPPAQQQPPPQETSQNTSPPAGGNNPMAMFAKPKPEGEDGDQGGQTPPPVPSAPPEPPAAQPPAQEPPATPPPPQQPPSEPPPPPPAEQQNQSEDETKGSPMSFFKKKDEE